MDEIFREMVERFNSGYSNILGSYERTSEEERKEMLRESYVIIDNFLKNGPKPVYYRSDEVAIFCLMIYKKWNHLKELMQKLGQM